MLWLVMLGALSALAEDSEFAGTENPPEAEVETPEAIEPETNLSAELGGTWATGNAKYFVVNSALNASHQRNSNKVAVTGGANLGSAVVDSNADGLLDETERDAGYSKNVERFFLEARYDRFFSERDSLYVLAGGFHDIFAGYDLRSHEQIGYSRLLVKTDPTELKAELGFDWAQENYVEGIDPDFQTIYAARLLLGLAHNFNEHVGFSDTFEVYENVIDPQDVRVLNTATLSAAINSKLSVKLSHALIFDNVPVEGFQPLDQTTMATLVASIL
jgi:putative salt-induced outer membrane protein YdiY